MKKRVIGLGGVFFKARGSADTRIELWEPMDRPLVTPPMNKSA